VHDRSIKSPVDKTHSDRSIYAYREDKVFHNFIEKLDRDVLDAGEFRHLDSIKEMSGL
jgi:hypothetical protein